MPRSIKILFVLAIIPILFITDYIVAVLVQSLSGIGFGGMLYFIYLIIADVIDEDELKTGVRREADTSLLEEPLDVGDYVLVRTGFIIAKLDPEQAKEGLKIYQDLITSNKKLFV